MRKAILLAAVVLLAACGSGIDLGSILGSPNPTTSSNVNGIVTGVDTNAQRIDLNVNTVNNLRPSSGQTTGSVYYDSNTRVTYQGQTYRPTDLERGDEISVTGANNNGRYIATTISVVRNVRG
jgi:hypothetical protein